MWGMDTEKVVKFLGEGLMKKKQICAKEELFRLWEAALPDELSSSSSSSFSSTSSSTSPSLLSLSLLRGLAIPLSDESNPLIRYCDRDTLPLDPKQRFFFSPLVIYLFFYNNLIIVNFQIFEYFPFYLPI